VGRVFLSDRRLAGVFREGTVFCATIRRTSELGSALRPIRKLRVHRAVEPVPLVNGAANEIVACGTAKLAPLLQHTYGGSILD
jgi:hypothetical protein